MTAQAKGSAAGDGPRSDLVEARARLLALLSNSADSDDDQYRHDKPDHDADRTEKDPDDGRCVPAAFFDWTLATMPRMR